MKLRPPLLTTLAVVLVMGIAWAPLLGVFDGDAWAVRVGGGVVVAAVVAMIVDSRWRPSVAVAAVATASGALIWAAAVVSDTFRSDPVSRAGWRDLRDGLFEGWSALMDDQVPLRDPAAAEIFVALLAWAASATAIHLTARRETPLAAMGVGAAVLWVATAAALPHGLASATIGAGLGMVLLLVVTTLTHGPDDRWSPGRVVSLLTMLVLAGAVATGAGAVLGTVRDDPVDPRTGRRTSVLEVEVPDILAEFSTRLTHEDDVLTVRPANPGAELPPLRLRLQTYDTYDGQRWVAGTEYREVATFPRPDKLPPGELVGLDIVLRRLDGPWLPLTDRLVSIDAEDLRWNPESQTALRRGGTRNYRLTGTVVDPVGLEGLATADVDERFTALPEGLPTTIQDAATAATDDATDAIGQIEALTAFVRELGRDDSLPPGQTLARLRDDLASAEPTGVVQLASLHALMARTLGHPTRIVVGYVPSDSTAVATDLHVWTEVAFTGVGWVPFDPVPAAAEPTEDVATSQTSTTTTLPGDGVIEARALPRELGPGEDPSEPQVETGRDYTWVDLAMFGAGALILTIGGLAAVRSSRRRLRRTDQQEAARLLGAWAEFVDRMREAGAPVTSLTTVDDIVFMATSMERELGEVAADLGRLASEALHGPHAPTGIDADQAWDYLEWAEDALVRVRGRRATLARYLDPRVLRHRAPEAPATRH